MPQVMDADRMSRALTRIAHEILERNGTRGTSDLALVGIRTRGVPLARRIAHALHEINKERSDAAELGRLVSATYPLARYRDAIAHAAEAGARGAVKIAFDLRQEKKG